jgi:predicted MFS family arabinose efflux permease
VGRAIWPLLLIAVMSTMPLTAISIFTPSIAADLDTGVAVIGGARIAFGAAALLCGALFAPLVDRLPRAWTVGGALVGLALASVLATLAGLTGIVLFYALAGAAGAILQPAIQSAAADGLEPAIGARAASLLSGVAALSATLAGLLLALPAAIWGWRGDFLAIGVILLSAAGLAQARLSRRPPAGVARPGYLTAFRLVGTAPGATALLLGSLLRSSAWFAWIAFLPAYFAEAFGAGLEIVALVWTLGGGGFFVGNQLAGRWAARGAADGRVAARLLIAGLLAGGALLPATMLAPSLPLAMLLAALAATAQGVALGGLISLLVRRFTPIRGAVMGLNAASFNLGTAGAVIGGLALAGGYPGLAASVALLTAGAVATTAIGVRQVEASPPAT